jgi:hypothetical protein
MTSSLRPHLQEQCSVDSNIRTPKRVEPCNMYMTAAPACRLTHGASAENRTSSRDGTAVSRGDDIRRALQPRVVGVNRSRRTRGGGCMPWSWQARVAQLSLPLAVASFETTRKWREHRRPRVACDSNVRWRHDGGARVLHDVAVHCHER